MMATIWVGGGIDRSLRNMEKCKWKCMVVGALVWIMRILNEKNTVNDSDVLDICIIYIIKYLFIAMT